MPSLNSARNFLHRCRHALVLLIVVVAISDLPLRAQSDPTEQRTISPSVPIVEGSRDSAARHWYDSLAITVPKYEGVTAEEHLALAAFVVASIPAGAAIIMATGLPPSLAILREDGISYGGLSISSGYGFTHDTNALLFFPYARVMLEGTWYFTRERSLLVRAAGLVDLPIAQIDQRGIYWLGMAGGGGISTDFDDGGPFAEGWVGVIVPMGIRFVGLYPMHNIGLRGRFGYDVGLQRTWYELSLGMTSTFW